MKYTKRVVINRGKVNAVRLVITDGLFEIGRRVIAASDPPDATPFGVGLVTSGGVIAYIDGKKVAGTTVNGQQISKPRAVKLPRPGIVAIAGFPFPGRLVHNGSINNRADPFLARGRDRILSRAGQIMERVVSPRLKRLR